MNVYGIRHFFQHVQLFLLWLWLWLWLWLAAPLSFPVARPSFMTGVKEWRRKHTTISYERWQNIKFIQACRIFGWDTESQCV